MITTAKGFCLPHFKIFWRFLGRAEGGRAIKRNFRRDQNISTTAAEEFTARIATEVRDGRGGRPIETMEVAITAAPALTLSGRTPKLPPAEVLVRWELLYDLNKRLATLSGGGSSDMDKLKDDLQSGVFTVLDGLRLGNRLDIVWCTLATEIDKSLAKREELGRICDKMGLRHICWGTVIEFRYPVGSPAKLRIPTTLDAFSSPDFRPADSRSTTGYAKDIRTGRKGLPEVIHEDRLLSSLYPSVNVRGEI